MKSMRLAVLASAALIAICPAVGAAQADSAAAVHHAELARRVLSRGVAAGGFPGAAVVAGTRDSVLIEAAFGRTAWEASTAPVTARGTVYDLASLTKVIATTSAIMVLVDDGRLRLDDRVSRHLPEFAGEGRDLITIRDLLLHRSGLPSGPDFRGVASPAEARRALMRTALVSSPGARTRYSDAGPMLLALVAERLTGESLDEFVHRRVFAPLGMGRTRFRPGSGSSIAPTATGATAGVHDRNARRLGGVAGHAGLFAPAADVARFARMMLSGGALDGVRVFRAETVEEFTSRQAGGRPLGWDSCAGGGRCGLRMSDAAFGHTGFTGTALWLDPVQGVFVIFLSNAVLDPHAYDPMAVLGDVRADLADLAVAASDARATPARLRSEIAINWFHPGAAPLSLAGN
jgi:CubicO group peptidase (beta-lactamase class C family)